MENNRAFFTIKKSDVLIPLDLKNLKPYTKLIKDENGELVLDENGKPKSEQIVITKGDKVGTPLHLVNIKLGKDDNGNDLFLPTVYEFLTPIKKGVYGKNTDLMTRKDGEQVIDKVTGKKVYNMFSKDKGSLDKAEFVAFSLNAGEKDIPVLGRRKAEIDVFENKTKQSEYINVKLPFSIIEQKLKVLEKQATREVKDSWKEIPAYQEHLKILNDLNAKEKQNTQTKQK